MQSLMLLEVGMEFNNLNLNNMTYSIDFKPLIRTLLSILLVGIVFYSVINNAKHFAPSINMYTPPADTVIITPPVLSFK